MSIIDNMEQPEKEYLNRLEIHMAEKFAHDIWRLQHQYHDTDIDFIEIGLERLRRELEGTQIRWQDICSRRIYEWSWSNFVTELSRMVFCSGCRHCATPGAAPRQSITEKQTLHVLKTIYELVCQHGIRHELQGYGGLEWTPLKYLEDGMRVIQKFKEWKPRIAPAFRFVLKYGPNTVVKQQALIRGFLVRRKIQKMKAVKIIEAWWFEVVNSPYTVAGRRMMAKRALAFHETVPRSRSKIETQTTFDFTRTLPTSLSKHALGIS